MLVDAATRSATQAGHHAGHGKAAQADDDLAMLTAEVADMPPAARPAAVAKLAGHLTPVEQGELLRAIDGAAPTRANTAAAPSGDGGIGDKIVDAVQSAVDAVREAVQNAAKAAHSTPLGIGKLLGADTAKLVAKSPSLTADMKKLEADGWVVKFGKAGGGTFADRTTKTITVDRNEKGDPATLVQSLAHEVGHARYSPHIDTSSKKAFLRTTLADEGAATISNIRAEREILKNDGVDIGVAGNGKNTKAYNAAYDAYIKDGNAAKARDKIGSIYGNGEHTSTTGETYNKYYGDFYDKAYGHK